MEVCRIDNNEIDKKGKERQPSRYNLWKKRITQTEIKGESQDGIFRGAEEGKADGEMEV